MPNRLSTMPNTTQFLTFYYFLLQYYFSSPDIYYLLLIFNYFFLFILDHTCLLFPWFLHLILLNFITSSSILLHLHFAFLLVRNFYVFYQYQCSNAFSQVLSLKFFNTIFFFLAVQVPLFISFLFIFFFPFEVFWLTECKFVLVLRTIFFFLSTNVMPAEFWISVVIYWNIRNRPEWPQSFFEVE